MKKALILIVTGLLFSVFAGLFFGGAKLGAGEVFACLFRACEQESHALILFELRLPRILAALVAGMALAAAGSVLQLATRNPLADPYLFGVVSGAGLGLTFGAQVLALHGFWLTICAFAGAMLSQSLVLFCGRYLFRVEQLLLVGVAISFLFSALTQFILYVGEPLASNRIIFWLLGNLSHVSLSDVAIIASTTLFSISILLLVQRQLNALVLGDEMATNLGVSVNKLRAIILILCALMTAVVVSFCGGIGFVGLMIPHLVRVLVGYNAWTLIIGSALAGGGFLIWVDVLARSLLPNQELPLGVITSLLGSLFFMFLLLGRQRFA